MGISMLKLSKKWALVLLNQPETGMDYQICTIVLKNGRKFEQAIISGGIISRIRNVANIPFHEEDIVEIVVTHDKWDFKRE